MQPKEARQGTAFRCLFLGFDNVLPRFSYLCPKSLRPNWHTTFFIKHSEHYSVSHAIPSGNIQICSIGFRSLLFSSSLHIPDCQLPGRHFWWYHSPTQGGQRLSRVIHALESQESEAGGSPDLGQTVLHCDILSEKKVRNKEYSKSVSYF